MKLAQSQLDYLFERGSNYDRKYYMFKSLLDIIKTSGDDVKTCIELFSGVGIETFYIKNTFDLDEHIAIDMDKNCCDIIRNNFNNIEVKNINCFNYSNNKAVDLLVVDSVFNNQEYNNIVSLIKRFQFIYLILTNTGVFHVRFDKGVTYESYWNELIERLRQEGLFTSNVIYSSDFGIMLIKNGKVEKCLINKIDNKNKSIEWRQYRDSIKKYTT